MMPHAVSSLLHMEQVNTEDCEGVSAGAFVFQSRPNHSLTHRQQQLVLWSLATVCFVTASGFALLGYWLILPFAGLEIGLLAWSLVTLRSREWDYETLTIDGDVIVLEWHAGTYGERREMNRQWVCVFCVCGSSGCFCCLCLC